MSNSREVFYLQTGQQIEYNPTTLEDNWEKVVNNIIKCSSLRDTAYNLKCFATTEARHHSIDIARKVLYRAKDFFSLQAAIGLAELANCANNSGNVELAKELAIEAHDLHPTAEANNIITTTFNNLVEYENNHKNRLS